MFISIIEDCGSVSFPEFSSTRVMMMPFLLEDIRGTVHLKAYRSLLIQILVAANKQGYEKGIAYLTIDEAIVVKGETHRRPGIHVDGLCPTETGKSCAASSGGWGGGGGGWGGGLSGGWGGSSPPPAGKQKEDNAHIGFFMAASEYGCQAWRGDFDGFPKETGDCSHLASQFTENNLLLEPNRLYGLSPLAVHQSIALDKDIYRQFIRVSMPSDAPWFKNYTPSPYGILPEGPIRPARKEMGYRK